VFFIIRGEKAQGFVMLNRGTSITSFAMTIEKLVAKGSSTR